MPQMMPINWILSFILFLSIFLIFISLNYYNYNIPFYFKKTYNNKINQNLTWKW